MSGVQKGKLANTRFRDALKAGAKAAAAALTAGTGDTTRVGGSRVQTNAAAVARFPLPLTLVSALLTAAGVIATMKDHKLIGVPLMVVGGFGLGAAAAAPELVAKLNDVGVEVPGFTS